MGAAIIRDPITEPKRLGKDLVVEGKIVDERATTSQIPDVAACPRIALWRYTPSPTEPKRFVIA
jgi:hypothetical protein